jgi:hypothetical protein
MTFEGGNAKLTIKTLIWRTRPARISMLGHRTRLNTS